MIGTRVVAASGADKKNVGGVRRFVLPIGIGEAKVVEDVTTAELEAAAKFMLARSAEMGTPATGAESKPEARPQRATKPQPATRPEPAAKAQEPIVIASTGR